MDTSSNSADSLQLHGKAIFAASNDSHHEQFCRVQRTRDTTLGATAFRAVCLLLLTLSLLLPTAAVAVEPNQLTPEQVADGWISLFDGETLFGWTPTSKANWKVEEGAITVSEGEEGFLATNAEFADYELHVEFKAPAATNSGVFLRTPLEPTDPTGDCIELNIAPEDNPFPTMSLVGRTIVPNVPLGEFPAPNDLWNGQWHTAKITLRGTHCSVAANDFKPSFSNRLDSDSGLTAAPGVKMEVPSRGHIALQFREGPVAFRNIRLKPLGLKPMLNGKDLAGWNTDKTEASKFEVAPDEELHVTNGRGQLETEATYGDFTMQLDCRVDGDGLNSGVFFRCIPRDFWNGYESQIHNVYKDNDPTKPADFGTGAIYRRVPARRVVSKDHEWFTKTIVATGPHMAVWVNGHQVTDWTDTRPEHENPRNGLRLKPGTIALQGHDPTTNLRFRNLRIAELPKANHEDTKDTKEEDQDE